MESKIWMAAQYRFISTYSIREPGTSTSMSRALPAPGPATVSLALLRQGIKLIGINETKDHIFPIVRSMKISIQPPEQIGITSHMVRGLKEGTMGIANITMFREFAYADTPMTVFIQIPEQHKNIMMMLLKGIRYWGQSESLAICEKIERSEPDAKMVIVPVAAVSNFMYLGRRYCCYVTEFQTQAVTWDAVVGGISRSSTPIVSKLYVWPLEVSKQWKEHKLLQLKPFSIQD